MNTKIIKRISFLSTFKQTVMSPQFVTPSTNSFWNSSMAQTKIAMKTLAIYFLFSLCFSSAIYGEGQKLTGFNNYTKWIDKNKDNRLSAKELLNLDEFVLNDKGTFSFLVWLPNGAESQTFTINAIDNDSGIEWKVYESVCDRGHTCWFELKPISGNITLTCSYLKSDVKHSLSYNYNPQNIEVDQNLNYFLSKEQIQKFSELNEEKVSAYKNAKSVSLVVIPNYARLVNMNIPFEKIAEKLLEFTGLDIVNADSTSFDLQIIINANGTSEMGVSNMKGPTGSYVDVTIYPEVGFTGDIIFKAANQAYYAKNFNWKKKFYPLVFEMDGFKTIQSWNQITNGYRNMFYHGSFLKDFGEMLINAFELNPVDFYLYASNIESDAISSEAIKLLGELHDARAYDPLVLIYKKESLVKRKAALNALGEMQDLLAFDILIEALDDKDYIIVISGARSLEKLGDKRAVEPLIRSIDKVNNNENWEGWEGKAAINVFIEVLGGLGDPTAIEYIIPLLKKSEFRENAQKALTKLTGRNIGNKYKDWIDWWDENKAEYRCQEKQS